MQGIGIGSFAVDWSVIASFLGSALVTPFFAIVNIFVGFALFLYVVLPTACWGLDLYQARNFPIFSSHLFNHKGEPYNVSGIVNQNFEIDMPAYEQQGLVNLSVFFSLTYGIGFAAIISTLSHVAVFNGK